MGQKTISHDAWHFLIPFLIELISIPFFLRYLEFSNALWLIFVIQLIILSLGFSYEWVQIYSNLDELYGGLEGFRRDSATDVLYMFLGMVFGGLIGAILYLTLEVLLWT